jgi:hypothetical protein
MRYGYDNDSSSLIDDSTPAKCKTEKRVISLVLAIISRRERERGHLSDATLVFDAFVRSARNVCVLRVIRSLRTGSVRHSACNEFVVVFDKSNTTVVATERPFLSDALERAEKIWLGSVRHFFSLIIMVGFVLFPPLSVGARRNLVGFLQRKLMEGVDAQISASVFC